MVLQQDVALGRLAKAAGQTVYLLWSTSARHICVPRSYSTVLKPFSQCSTCWPFTTIRAWFHSPTPLKRTPCGGIMS